MRPNNPPMTPEDAIFDIRERMVRMETVLTGVPGTDDTGLCGTVRQTNDELDATRKKVGRLEIKFWSLVGMLIGSGVLGGFGIARLIG